MAFSSTNLMQVTPGSLSNGAGAVWHYRSSDASTDVAAAGYFAAVGRGSRGGAGYGMNIGDVVIVSESSGGGTPGRTTMHSVKASTANQASTSASSGYNAAYNVTISSTP
jgi:hypothetical protein